MRSAVCQAYGPPESLAIVELPDPTPGPGKVVVNVAYAAVNFPDVLILANRYQVTVPLPFVPGSEFAGIVAKVGEGVTNVAVGDRVFGAAMSGAFSEQVIANAAGLKPVPAGVGLDVAAAFWVAHMTAYHGLRSVAEVVPGEIVVVLGAAGGVGLASVEVAASLGATVIAAASSEDKLALCRERGATMTVNYVDNDLRAVLRDIAPNGVDVVIDPVGGPYAEQALRALRYKGRFVTVGFASGEIPRIPLNLILLKGCVIKGFEVRTFSDREPELAARDIREMIDMLSTGRLVPHISAVYPLDQVAQALNDVAGRRSIGKVLVAPGRVGV